MVRYSLTFSCKNLYEEAFSKSDPYIKLLLNGVTLGRTETIANAKSPQYVMYDLRHNLVYRTNLTGEAFSVRLR